MARDQTQEVREASSSNSTSIIHLLDIPDPADNDTFRITDWTQEITFPESGGDTYIPWPIQFEKIPIDQSSEIERTRITASNITLEMRTLLRENEGLADEDVRIRKVNPNILGGEDDVYFDVTYRVEQASWKQQNAQLDLRSPFDRSHKRLTNTITRERFPGIPQRRAFIR